MAPKSKMRGDDYFGTEMYNRKLWKSHEPEILSKMDNGKLFKMMVEKLGKKSESSGRIHENTNFLALRSS